MTSHFNIASLKCYYRMEFECHFVLARVALIDEAERDLESVAVSGLERITGNGLTKTKQLILRLS